VWVAAYAVGALLAMTCIFELAPRFSAEDSVPHRGRYALVGAALWPVVLIGVVQICALSAYARRVRSRASHRHAAREALSTTR
jgi:hypothetical protein